MLLLVLSLISSVAAYGEKCAGVEGTCKNVATSTCSVAWRSYLCPGDSSNKCCPDVSDSSVDSDTSVPVPQPVVSDGGAFSGAVFPLAPGSLASISVNWGGSRSNGRRCHAGIDLYTTGARRVVAAGDGQVVSVMRGWYGCSGGSIDAIMVYHSSGPLAGKTINYGEVNPGTYNLAAGSRVTRGQTIGVASRCGMLHLELYNQRVAQNYHWYPRGSIGNAFNGCMRNHMATKPSVMENPIPLIQATRPAGARFYGGTSFLNDDGDANLAAEEDSIPDAETGAQEETQSSLDAGVIAAIVIGVVIVVIVAIVLVAFFVVRRSRTAAAAVDVGESNNAIALKADDNAPPATLTRAASASTVEGGSFACQHCGKTYAVADDLLQHVATRHA